MNVNGGGDTDAPFVKDNPIPKELYHTDWVADHTIRWIDSMDPEDDWYCWMSFPDPHHPTIRRRRRSIGSTGATSTSTSCYGESDAQRARLAGRQAEALEVVVERREVRVVRGAGGLQLPSTCSTDPDKIREINAMIHIENAIMDDAIGRVLDHLEAKGWLEDTDIIFTPDHGGLDGDSGLLLIGPALVDTRHPLHLTLEAGRQPRRRAGRRRPLRSG